MDNEITRRNLLGKMGAFAIAAGLPIALAGCSQNAGAKLEPVTQHHLARYWKSEGGKVVTCQLCPHQCTTQAGESGFCRARKNVDGQYFSLVYGQPVAMHNDPIEKKPFNHVLPGTTAFSIGSTGCNLRCKHCQNWQLSQSSPGDLKSRPTSPAQLVALAKKAQSTSVAFTYNEPTTNVEYMIDSAAQARKNGLGALIISNGFIRENPQRDLVKQLTAYKVDLKGFSEKFYTEVCSAHLKPVLDTLERLKKWGIWLEIVTLLIPTLNDNEKELQQLARWVVEHLGKDVPIHFTRFHPMYKLQNLPPTPVPTLERAYEIAKAEGIHYAYVGNVPGHKHGNTYCPKCSNLLIQRYAFSVEIKGLEKGKCASCQTVIPGVWSLNA